MYLSSFVCLVGKLYVLYLMVKCFKFVWELLKTTIRGGNVDFPSFGEWAVVTGCTDGIGKEYAKQLAAKGLNIILMSRSEEKLHAIATEIENDYKVKTKIMQVDFSGGHEIYEPIARELEGYEIGVLVNNVAVGVPRLGYLHELPNELMWQQVNANIMSALMMTRSVISAMVERRKGVIINISSHTALMASPFVGAYGATKACLNKFSENLHIEYADQGIIVQNVNPLWVATKMSGKKPALFSPAPDVYVRSVLKKLGITLTCYGYWPHELQAFVFRNLPKWLAEKIAVDMLRSATIPNVNIKKKS